MLKNVAFALLCLLAVGGCSSGDTGAATTTNQPAVAKETASDPKSQLIGRWEAVTGAEGEEVVTEFVFNDDGTYEMVTEGVIGDDKKPMFTEASGTFNVEGDKLSFHTTSVKMTSPDAKVQQELDKMNEQLKDTTSDTGGTFKFEGDDKVTFKQDAVGEGSTATEYRMTRLVEPHLEGSDQS